jgi:hypothetical protein
MLGNRTDRSAINVAMRKVAAEADSFAAPLVSQPTAVATTPLGSFSRSLGSLLPGAEGDGTSLTERRLGSGPGVRRARVKITGHAPLPPFNGEPAVGVSFRVTAKPSSTATRVSARVGAALDDGSIESEPPDNAATPRLLGWMDPHGRVVRQEVVTIPARDTADWIAVISLVPDTSSGIDLTAEAVE